MSTACKHLSVTCFQAVRQKSIKEDVGFQGLPGKTNHPLSVALVTCLCPDSESSAGNMKQKPISSGREQLTFGNLTCILQQRL